ncbi:50S ribosomal protein L24 [Marinitoga sp. 1135]|uniref:Large ribosomal subunit protein uL24 n=1 Tax=Marinitoga piezophila (strain DSM 14283 / JCM 11233 / KA3) TaxID=443254 RepID=H2J793_MARPK|nr:MULTISPECIES: 50S ribosomal protein L24 [Marinitoga]AEX85285.1 ribosomal protein L24, bacterial/organelle [Marinitoga piezophila KA3]APT75770.1 50S ribosomal protein L24 [Marinitoga sp. 1137]NUU95511.1 50S ribosomal protein L24 [Marinitoga sp. 1135]NUU97438.1 50S ribosomal protein L24 [Marinitoga sp. 1138]
MKVKKGDLVRVISGKDKGKEGKVLRVMPKLNKIIVENVNIVKKHQRPTQQLREGGIIEQPAPIYANKVMVVCPNCGKPTRVGYRVLEEGKKVRVCRKCNEIIDKV